MGEKSRGLLTSAIMMVFVAALPHRHSWIQENSKMLFHLDDQQEKNKNGSQRKRRKPSRNDDLQLVEVCLQSFLSQLTPGNIHKLQNLQSTATTDGGEAIRDTTTALELKKIVCRGRFSASLSHKLTSVFGKAINDFSSYMIPTNAVCVHYSVNAFESVVKEHFLLHAKPTKTCQSNCLSTVVTSASHVQEDLKGQFLYNFLLSCTVYFDHDLDKKDLKFFSTRIFSALSFRDVTTCSDQSNSPHVTTCLSLRVLPSSLCIDQAIEPEAQSELTELCLSKATDTKKCIPSESNLSNESISSVKVISVASSMDLSEQINNMANFPMEVDVFGGLDEAEILRRVGESDMERVGVDGMALENEESDYEDPLGEDESDFSESEDSDSFCGSYSNPSPLGTSPLPGRSPSPHSQNYYSLELNQHSTTIFDLRQTFCPSPAPEAPIHSPPVDEESEESDQAVPNSIVA